MQGKPKYVWPTQLEGDAKSRGGPKVYKVSQARTSLSNTQVP